MIHSREEIFKMVKTLCKKTLALHDHYSDCEDCIRVFELDDIAYLARLLNAELGEINNED